MHLGPSRLDSDSILEGFGGDLGGSWEGLGRILANLGMDFGNTWGRIWMRAKKLKIAATESRNFDAESIAVSKKLTFQWTINFYRATNSRF